MSKRPRFTTQEGKPSFGGLPFWAVLDHAEQLAYCCASEHMARVTVDHLATLPMGLAAHDYYGSHRLYQHVTREDTTP